MKKCTMGLTGLIVLLCVSPVGADIFGGIDFPGGISSFADAVVSYGGGAPAPTDPDFLDPASALGPPDFPAATSAVSLGRGGHLTVEFTDNVLRGSGNSDVDLHIFEIGGDVEDTYVEISKDGTIWEPVGMVFGATSSIDIDAFGFGPIDEFLFVRLTDDADEGQQSGPTVGADIDAIGAISSRAGGTVPEPSTFIIWALGLLGLAAYARRRK